MSPSPAVHLPFFLWPQRKAEAQTVQNARGNYGISRYGEDLDDIPSGEHDTPNRQKACANSGIPMD
jgi:hypothetical protein